MIDTARTILVIEDNPGDVRLLREMLRATITVLSASSMREAEAMLAERSVDIVLLDLGLPDVQGLDAVRQARRMAPHVPLVVLTGTDDDDLGGLALQEGAQEFLIKGQIESRGLLRSIRYATERKAMEEALFEQQERAQVTLNCIGDAVACTDADGNISFLNRGAETMTGWSMAEALGRPMDDVLRIRDAVTKATIANPMENALAANQTGRLQPNCVLVRRDGSETPIEDSVAPIHDREGNVTGAVMVLRDVGLTRTMALKLAHSAQHDFLTGLPNRMLLNDRIDQAISAAPRHAKKVAILFLDLDGFKHINDSLGHSIGDKLLQSVSQRLVDCVRGSDTVSRQGGDEFVVLLSEVEHAADAAMLAQRILESVAQSHEIGAHALKVTTSIGISVYPEDGLDAETLTKNADTAMYQAKAAGRHGFQFFKPTMNVRFEERQSIEVALRQALERREFALHYQPKVNLLTGQITGSEALIRWMHPTRGPISPSQFVPVAEDSGLIAPIGAWVLREACEQAKTWLDAGLPAIKMSVNISALEFRDDRFLASLFEILGDTGLDPSSLELDLTETVLLTRADSSTAILKTLRDHGVSVAVDDFGTGYSSLSYLRKFAVSSLKIDQSFIQKIGTDGEDSAIVRAVIGVAQNLKLQVIAEGVETQEELAFLKDHLCDEAQGYFFSRPVMAKDFATLLGAMSKGTAAPNVEALKKVRRPMRGAAQ